MYRTREETYQNAQRRVEELKTRLYEMERRDVEPYERPAHEVGISAVRNALRTESGRLKTIDDSMF